MAADPADMMSDEGVGVINATTPAGGVGTAGGSPDDDGMVVLPDDRDDDLQELKVDRDVLLKFSMAYCIVDFKHDVRELVEALLKPRHELEEDWTRELSAERAADRERLPFVGLDATAEPPEQLQQEEEKDEGQPGADDDGDGDGQKDPPVSAAGFVDRLQMRMLIQAFFHPDLVDVEDEGKDTRSARNFMGNFMAATGFVNRLWDVRRIIAVCRDRDLDDAARKETAAEMLRRLEELLHDRAKAVASGRYKLIGTN